VPHLAATAARRERVPRGAALAAALALSLAASGAAAAQAGPYAAAPDDPFNILHRALFLRVALDGRAFGIDEPEPLLWPWSTYLLKPPRHDAACAALRAFCETCDRGDAHVGDPLRRALLQRDLWAVFDWVAAERRPEGAAPRAALEPLLAAAIERLLLTEAELHALPDNYAAAVASGAFAPEPGAAGREHEWLPADLLAADGSWVAVLAPAAAQPGVPPSHALQAEGRSVFSVHLRLPGGREATLGYLEKVAAFPDACVQKPAAFPPPEETAGAAQLEPRLNPALPQFPAGTAVALVRRLLLPSREGTLVPTRLVESVQIRVFREVVVPPLRQDDLVDRDWTADQQVLEFELFRAPLLAGEHGGLVPVKPGERRLQLFGTHGGDPLEALPGESLADAPQVHLATCINCHGAPGIVSVNTFTGFATGPGTHFAAAAPREPSLRATDLPAVDAAAVAFKAARDDWALLQRLMGDAAR
jgi:hypothetical protein